MRRCFWYILATGAAWAWQSPCDLSHYRPQEGLTAETAAGGLRVNWTGEHGQQLRAAFAIDAGRPVIRELAARKSTGQWGILGTDLTPEYEITSGQRRISNQQLEPLRKLGRTITPELIE